MWLGTCFDVYLNDVAYWRCVPLAAWRYTIGDHQVTTLAVGLSTIAVKHFTAMTSWSGSRISTA